MEEVSQPNRLRARLSAAEAKAATSLTVPGFAGRPALAVLAFQNMSGDPDQEYFADGIAEDLITRLAAFRQFPVIARNSSFAYKGRSVDVKQVSEELGVRYVVEGSVRKAGDRVRVTAQLVDATSGHHVWAERYDRKLEDIFALQDELVDMVMGALEPALARAEERRVVAKSPEAYDAWDCARRGTWHLNRFTKEDILKAQEWTRKACEIDPTFPDALSADDPLAHFALGICRSFLGQHEAAITTCTRALELTPSFALGARPSASRSSAPAGRTRDPDVRR